MQKIKKLVRKNSKKTDNLVKFVIYDDIKGSYSLFNHGFLNAQIHSHKKMTLEEQKRQVRTQMKLILSNVDMEQREQRSADIINSILNSSEYKKAGVIMAFLSMRHEVDTTRLILDAFQQNKTVAVPQISWEQRHMIPVEITSLESGFKIEKMGIRNPIRGTPVPFEDIDLVIVPGLAFDRQGHRLGRGGGYYDRFFADKLFHAKTMAVAFSAQILDTIPYDNKDACVDILVSEKGVLRFVNNTT